MIYIYLLININKFKVYLDSKIKIEEEYFFLRIYNGKKWIELKNYKLNKNYISINFESEFCKSFFIIN